MVQQLEHSPGRKENRVEALASHQHLEQDVVLAPQSNEDNQSIVIKNISTQALKSRMLTSKNASMLMFEPVGFEEVVDIQLT